MLVGAALNMQPELFHAAIADVPFVDVLNTMSDENLPLTPPEWPEWGNPIEDKRVFEHIRSYSPYDELKAGSYPAMLVTAGLNDPRVTYWEPAKWVQQLRNHSTSGNEVLLKTEMSSGHFARSGRYDLWRDEAIVLAFVLSSVLPQSGEHRVGPRNV